jgi:ferric-chelate reductase
MRPSQWLTDTTVIVVAGYLSTILSAIFSDSYLDVNPNRPGKYHLEWEAFVLIISSIGMVAVAQLPLVFILGSKESVLPWLLGHGRGYEKLNILHRWVGRGIVIGGLLHGGLWISFRRRYGIPPFEDHRGKTGITAVVILAVITLSSFRLVRRLFYQSFYFVQ